ncbi:DUF547 domain-containing protein [Marinoscillum furvescens]|uniref:Uncharacterized protein DUF547 n=1 Tax=Marinoscillum furvescens DSM 4134 TaxID=1122208 RepID=A0A3D9L2N4_MARFU|nr:DUF547 domain-containing protein [Marinoscillum furvescens]RED99397.1 uncharacterized protein DUF547 [Marinoscillum furvescens DSM 4134]
MKSLFLTLGLFLATTYLASGQSFFQETDRFLATHVHSGLIHYDSISKKPQALNQLIESIAAFQLAGTTPEEQKAFYINAYNLLVIKLIIDNYPTEGPMSIPGFFNQKKVTVTNRSMTLDELEKEILFEAFPDPRLHFVLVCAAVGCPPISDFAYSPDSLEQQIQRKTESVLNTNWYVRVHKDKTYISKVFDWYREDFVTDSTDVKAYINAFRKIAIPKNHPLEIYPYDWSLNDTKSSVRF